MYSSLASVEVPKTFYERYDTGSVSTNNALGDGGLHKACMVMISGTPGAGKSTWSMVLLDCLANINKVNCLLVSGEEDRNMVKLRLEKLNKRFEISGIKKKVHGNFMILDSDNGNDSFFMEADILIKSIVKSGAKIIVIDSMQKLSFKGKRSNTAILRAAERLYSFCSIAKVTILAICQSNKTGSFAGLQGFEHEVDVHIGVNSLAPGGKTVIKNRFGTPGISF